MNAFAKVDKDAFFRFAADRRHERYEFVRGHIVQQMTGGTLRHNRICHRFARLIEDQLDAQAWIVAPERGVDTGSSVRYPEMVVEPATEPGTSLATSRPAIILEVTSPSSIAIDLDEKPAEYLMLETLDAYLVASQSEVAVLLWLRGGDGQFPREPTEIVGGDGMIAIDARCGRISLRLADIYDGIL